MPRAAAWAPKCIEFGKDFQDALEQPDIGQESDSILIDSLALCSAGRRQLPLDFSDFPKASITSTSIGTGQRICEPRKRETRWIANQNYRVVFFSRGPAYALSFQAVTPFSTPPIVNRWPMALLVEFQIPLLWILSPKRGTTSSQYRYVEHGGQ